MNESNHAKTKTNPEKNFFKTVPRRQGWQTRPMGQIWPTTCFCKQDCIDTWSCLFMYGHFVYGCFCSRDEQLQQRPSGPQTLKYFLSGFLQKKLLTPAVKHPYCSPAPEIAEYVVYNYNLYLGKKIFSQLAYYFCFRTENLDTITEWPSSLLGKLIMSFAGEIIKKRNSGLGRSR